MAQTDSLPPLQPLRVLEACARHASFSKAAEELGVTPGAITQQIRTIEAWVGVPLFKRTGRSVTLTEAMQAALPNLSEGFDRIAEAARSLRTPTRRQRIISLSVTPSFASKWLLPRLDRFKALQPDVDVWVAADMKLTDFSYADIDIAIRYGAGAYDGLVAEKLLAESVRPIASPELVRAFGPFTAPADLVRAPLLHYVDPEGDPSYPDWTMWLKARGVAKSPAIGARFNQSSMLIEQAVAGKGVALAKDAIAQEDLAAGRLVALLNDSTPLPYSYWVVWPRGRTLSPPVRAFIAWVKAEAAGERQSQFSSPEFVAT
ncbi:MAG: transcriptional regulator GcvA [Alphaproteobacteria bacterium]